MAKYSSSPPSGTRDFYGNELRQREAVIRIIQGVFEAYGFHRLETPAFERIDLLTDKYGDDERLIFKIASRGAKGQDGGTDLALRYDLTVPLARYVAGRERGQPFRRYQIAPVWRADRPGKGRFREFYQCDVDIVGARSSLADAEVVLSLADCLNALEIGHFTIRANSRKALAALVASYGVPQPLAASAIAAVDKLMKIGPDGVAAELRHRGIPESAIVEFIHDASEPSPTEAAVARLLRSPDGRDGYAEVQELMDLVRPNLSSGEIIFDPHTARGLDYYTGVVFEFFSGDGALSIASGGRYDGLIGLLAGEATPACGGSLGFERILPLVQRHTDEGASSPEVLVCVWNHEGRQDALTTATEMRAAGISTETYLGDGTLSNQLRYAAKNHIPKVVIIGPDEVRSGVALVKDMDTGHQDRIPRDQLLATLGHALPHAGQGT